MNKQFYLYYFNKFQYFAELCRKGYLDTTNHYILDMYNTTIKYETQMKLDNIDLKKLDSLIDEFNKNDLEFYMFIHKDETIL